MLEHFVEKEIVRKIDIVNFLWESEEMTSIELGTLLNVTATTVKNDVKAINLYYCPLNDPLILSSSNGYSILNKKTKNKRDYLKAMYNDSLFIRSCCFNLRNNFQRIEKFAEDEFISISKSYELRKQVLNYIEKMGIYYFEEDLPNNECRIRFLIAYFQMKLGIDIVSIPSFNQYHFDQLFLIFEKLENCMLSSYSKEYASILFQLDYERNRNLPIRFDPESVNLLKSSTVYKRLKEPLNAFLKEEFHSKIEDDHLLYYALILNIMNANYVESTELQSSYNAYAELIKQSESLNYKRLVELFIETFGKALDVDSLLFEAPLIIFLRKCIFNLQTLIPEEHLELGNMAVLPKELLEKVTTIFYRWIVEIELPLSFSPDHIKYLTSKLYFLINKRERSKKLYILTSFFTDYLLAKELLSTEYGALVEIEQFDAKKAHSYLSTDLILYDTTYEILEKLPCQKKQVSFIFDLDELHQIRDFLFEYNLDDLQKSHIVETED